MDIYFGPLPAAINGKVAPTPIGKLKAQVAKKNSHCVLILISEKDPIEYLPLICQKNMLHIIGSNML